MAFEAQGHREWFPGALRPGFLELCELGAQWLAYCLCGTLVGVLVSRAPDPTVIMGLDRVYSDAAALTEFGQL